MSTLFTAVRILVLFVCLYGVVHAAEPVNVDNFNRAETDNYFKKYADNGYFGVIKHDRQPTPIDKQTVVRMNREIIYSVGVFDLTEPMTIVKPDTGERFQSMQVVNQDHYTQFIAYKGGEYTLTQEEIGTRYVIVMFRTVMDPDDPKDLAKAHAWQDKIAWRQKAPGKLEIPDWDQERLTALRKAILTMSPFVPDSSRMFGKKADVNPVRHLWGTAAGFLGQPMQDVIYVNVTPEKNDGKTSYVLHIPARVPVDGFWSISLYNADGFFQKNPQNAYSVNSFSAKANKDGSVTVHFGGAPTQPNFLAIMPGWNYTFRFYRPREEIVKGTWTAPKIQPAQ